MENIKIFGTRVDKITQKEAIKKVENFLQEDEMKAIYTPNTEIIMEAREDNFLRKVLNSGDMVIPDGIGLIYASRIKKRPLPERVTGFDLSINMLELANREGYSVFLLGGKEGIAKKAGENIIKEYPNISIAGYNNGYFKGSHTGTPGDLEELEVLDKINNTNPDILFVGFGAPKQEKWIYLNKDRLNCRVVIGNGGTIDILAGKVKRAPEIYQKLGLEWLYRLVKEPSRIKRQIVLPKFMLKVIFEKNVIE